MIRIFATIGFILALIGGLLLIFIGIAAALGIFWLIFYPAFALTALFWGIIIFVLGLIAAGGAKFVRHLGTALLLLLVGIVASLLGAWFAAWLIVVGAIFGILSKL
ncbi:MAG: hypothetical protein NWE93_02555 [Candidatus Bathyarchaeota archaeon]|nr:hypothetical protein [Candidatus Bathyarchaeota archaeon]